MRFSSGVLVFAFALSARADEGMWTFNHFPSARVERQYGFSPSPEWLDRVRLASLRLAGGCSASLVSSEGLVLTNHHCAHHCIEKLSTAQTDRVAQGFSAHSIADEVRCPSMEANQLLETTDVTARMNAATTGLSDRQFNEARKAEMSRIEKECATSDDVRCEVVSLYQGGRVELCRYRRFQDVRLVFAPEMDIAFFGGDPDNFNFPRYDLDFALLRLYQDGKPVPTPTFLPLTAGSPKDGELVFVSGNPGTTNRHTPVAEVEFERDVNLPRRLVYAAELRGILEEFATESSEHRRVATNRLFSTENSFKARQGRLRALQEPGFVGRLAAAEAELRKRVNADPKLRRSYAKAWDAIAQALQTFRPMRDRYNLVEQGQGFFSELFDLARLLVRAADELPKANERRLREYADSNLPALRQRLFSPAPIDDDLESTTLAFGLSKLREGLGADDRFVVKVLGKQSPRQLATTLIKGTRLKDARLRQTLFDGGRAAVEGSADPLIRFVRLIDPDARMVRQRYEDEVEAPLRRNGQLVARAFFAVYGTDTYPDATFTARLSYGQVKGWREGDRIITPLTTLGGTFERATDESPFRLPATWLKAKRTLDLATPFNVVTTNDIIGGNSGSPLINRNGQVVGVIFDGNIHSLANDFAYNPTLDRAVAVTSSAILEALEKIYGATRVHEELSPAAR
jgi:hypothetical protein